MNEKKATKILKDFISKDGLYANTGNIYLNWTNKEAIIILDGNFGADYLEAIIWWMRNKINLKEPSN